MQDELVHELTSGGQMLVRLLPAARAILFGSMSGAVSAILRLPDARSIAQT
jgi:hypothetical protein